MKRAWVITIQFLAGLLTVLFLNLAGIFLTGPINNFFHLKLSKSQVILICAGILLISVLEIGFQFFSGIFFWLVGYIRYLTKYILLTKEEGIGFAFNKMFKNQYSFDEEMENIHNHYDGKRVISGDDTNYRLDKLFKPTFFERINSLFNPEKKPPKK